MPNVRTVIFLCRRWGSSTDFCNGFARCEAYLCCRMRKSKRASRLSVLQTANVALTNRKFEDSLRWLNEWSSRELALIQRQIQHRPPSRPRPDAHSG